MYNKPHACYEWQRGREKIVSEPKTAVWGSSPSRWIALLEGEKASGGGRLASDSGFKFAPPPPQKKITKVENSPWRAGLFFFYPLFLPVITALQRSPHDWFPCVRLPSVNPFVAITSPPRSALKESHPCADTCSLLSSFVFSSSHPPPLAPCVPMRAVSFHARIGPSAPSTTPACSVRKSCTWSPGE